MTIFLNGREPPYMQSSEKIDLSAGQVQHSVMSMTYCGLQVAAAVGLHLMSAVLGLTPAQITEVLECEDKKPSVQIRTQGEQHEEIF